MFFIRLMVVALVALLGAGCASSDPGYLRGPLPKIAVAYNLVPWEEEAGTRYGGEHTLAVHLDEALADQIREDFVRRAARAAPLPMFALESPPLPAGLTCPSMEDLSLFAKGIGVSLILCVDRSFYYNDLIGAAVATTRIGLYSAEGTILWRGASTRGINLSLSDSNRNVYEETRAAALLSNEEIVEDLHRALAILN